jgi:hypothetical protein
MWDEDGMRGDSRVDQDWGLYLPILRCLREQADLRLHLVAAGAHLAFTGHGQTDSSDSGGRI